MKIYLERLYHYCCEYCEKWWLIAGDWISIAALVLGSGGFLSGIYLWWSDSIKKNFAADIEREEMYLCPHCFYTGYIGAIIDKKAMTDTTSTTRAKFTVDSTTNFAYGTTNIALSPVVGGDSAENDNFFASTPSGEISLTIKNPLLADFFQPGAEYYVDFTPVIQPSDSDDEDALTQTAANA